MVNWKACACRKREALGAATAPDAERVIATPRQGLHVAGASLLVGPAASSSPAAQQMAGTAAQATAAPARASTDPPSTGNSSASVLASHGGEASTSPPPTCEAEVVCKRPAAAGAPPRVSKRPAAGAAPATKKRPACAQPAWRQLGLVPLAMIHGEAFATRSSYFGGTPTGAQNRRVHDQCDFRVDAARLLKGDSMSLRSQGFLGVCAGNVKELLDHNAELSTEPVPSKCLAAPSRRGNGRVDIRRPLAPSEPNVFWRISALDAAGVGYGAASA